MELDEITILMKIIASYIFRDGILEATGIMGER